MIRLFLSGGLGNQMFQYATAKSLSVRTGQKLIIDNHLFYKKTKSTPRPYELQVFTINLKPNLSFIEKYILKVYRGLSSYPTIQRTYASIFNIYSDKALKHFESQIIKSNKDIRLFGYFQNENYFKEYASVLKADFTFKNMLQGRNKEVLQCIRTSQSVSVHIRRGDYLMSNSNLRILSLEYYTEAINYLKNKIDKPSFFIFSDDIEWVKNTLFIDKEYSVTYIDWNTGDNSFVDMQLMSACENNIIANSSFSWWAAWLNSHSDKMIIAPSLWYKNANRNSFEEGFIPEGWITI